MGQREVLTVHALSVLSCNYTLPEALFVLHHHSATLQYNANAGVNENVVERTVEVYLWVGEYILQATKAPSTSNTTANA